MPEPALVTCYCFEEVFAEKLRAMGERSRRRDLYDIVNLYRRDDLRLLRDQVHDILVDKCAHKQIDVPTFASIQQYDRVTELESEWDNMLAHQLPVLPLRRRGRVSPDQQGVRIFGRVPEDRFEHRVHRRAEHHLQIRRSLRATDVNQHDAAGLQTIASQFEDPRVVR